MKFKNKGRKIYKTKEKNYYGKTPTGKFFSVALSILLIGGICFIGYSVAEPLLNYTKKKGDGNLSTSESNSEDPMDNSSQSTSPTINVQENNNVEQYKATALSVNDMLNINTLTNALGNITAANDVDYIEVPLKVSGGKIYYASEVYKAQMSGAVTSQLTLSEILSEIRKTGYRPVANISMFDDNLMPLSYPQMGYVTVETGQQWIDNNLENGGKPWVTPFSQEAVDYLKEIVGEVSSAGFEKVVCSDFVFPYFRESDLAYLGEEISSPDRYLAMTSAANVMYDTILSNGSTMMMEVSAVDLLRGNAEVIQPMLLNVNTIILNVDFDEIGQAVLVQNDIIEFKGSTDEIATDIVGRVKDDIAEYNVAVRFSGENVNKEELIKAKEKIAGQYGYLSYVIG